MGDHGAAVLLALLGAACFAVASTLQHHEVRTGRKGSRARPGPDDGGAHDERLAARRLLTIMRRPRWLAGLGLAGVGAAVHALALLLAPLRVVQPIGVLAVPLTVVIATARTRRRPPGGVVVGTAVAVAGVATFVAASAGTATSRTPTAGATVGAGVAVLVLVVALRTVAGSVRSGTARCLATATAGASAFGLVSVFVRVLSEVVTSDGVTTGAARVLGTAGGLVVALVVGGWLVQQAYHAGSPELVIACLTVVDPIVAVLLGALVLGEGAGTSPATWALLAVAAVAATAGVLVLARHHPDAVRARAAARPASRSHHPWESPWLHSGCSSAPRPTRRT
ncbi:hypothetical protein GXB85_07575 [Cellulomonas sp. APG4]|uniref:hypothetical protein n=1 Tax=Cellulomonas sp. APG4 TaxID=1538656 RepID=UPI00137A66DE|nr:hypothetical protein [Cellulomonas sp. APG4]NCT90806.1 hypothetical protein [Cellulomonas sp. APG4]